MVVGSLLSVVAVVIACEMFNAIQCDNSSSR